MKICDAHNDFLTEIKNVTEKANYLKFIIKKNRKIKYVCCQVWTSNFKNPLRQIKNLKNQKTILSP